jgi:hypothetical protein
MDSDDEETYYEIESNKSDTKDPITVIDEIDVHDDRLEIYNEINKIILNDIFIPSCSINYSFSFIKKYCNN